MQPFPHIRPCFSTADEYLAEQRRLRSLVDSVDLCEVDELGNTDTIGHVARLALARLSQRCRNAAWKPAARATLEAAGLL